MTTTEVLAALAQLYSAGGDDRAAVSRADEWLREFQKSEAAWSVADHILRDDGMAMESQLFAAQTIRQKIRYDWSQLVSSAQKMMLRDALLSFLFKFKNGPRAVTKQLCIGVAVMAVHLKEWADPVATLIEAASRDGIGLDVLMIVLAALPYEFEDSTTDSSFFEERDPAGVTQGSRQEAVIIRNAPKVLHTTISIMDKCPTQNFELQKLCLDCIRSWSESGGLSLDAIGAANIVPRCVAIITTNRTQDSILFETVVDVLSEVIRRSGSNLGSKNQSLATEPLIESMYSGLLSLCPLLQQCISSSDGDDEDCVRSLCRLFTIAGESYLSLILKHIPAWKVIVDAILACTTASDLEVVAITFQFWLILADEVSTPSAKETVRPHYVNTFRSLCDIIIKHLHYPSNSNWTAEERDEFRDFRHNMGDVLKACVLVLGEGEALSRPCSILKSFSSGNGALDPTVSWQRIEAPLFAIRTMGRNISDSESIMMPGIMGMLPQLPDHPKVRYSAILVIGRYASWTKLHPEFLSFQMTFISKGFEDKESMGAASQALRFLCDECGDRLVDYLSQLHPFYLNIMKSLDRMERTDVVTALASVIQHVPVQVHPGSPDMLTVLEMFCLPIAQRLHEIGQAGFPAGVSMPKEVETEVEDLVDQFTSFAHTAQPVMPNTSAPHPCVKLFQGMWPVLLHLLSLPSGKITNKVCRCIVKCADAHKHYFRPAIRDVLQGLAQAYEQTEVPSLMWAASKCLKEFGGDGGDDGVVVAVVETISRVAFRIIQEANGKVDHVSDTVEDFFLMAGSFVTARPVQAVSSSFFPAIFQCSIACMHIQQFDAWLSLYTVFFKSFFVLATSLSSFPSNFVIAFKSVLNLGHAAFVQGLVKGLTTTFPYREDISHEQGSGENIIGFLVISFCACYRMDTNDGVRLIMQAMQGMQDPKWKEEDRVQFLEKLSIAITKGDAYRVDVLMHDYGVKYKRRNTNSK